MSQFLVIGMGKTGESAVRFLLSSGEQVIGYDDRKQVKDIPSFINGHSRFSFLTRDKIARFDWKQIHQCVVSPGVPFTHPLLAKCEQHRIPVISEIELACQMITFPLIGITGSNGKSTTVALLSHILKGEGLSVFIGGNFGIPLLESISSSISYQWGVVELSSFQLERISTARFNIAGILNLSLNHLDRHLTFKNYFQQKLKIFMNQKKSDIAVINLTRPKWHTQLCTIMQGIVVPITCSDHLQEGFFWKKNNIIERQEGKMNVIDCQSWGLPGEHNRENLLFASAMARMAGVKIGTIEKQLSTFKGLDHRIQKIAEINGIVYYDDSKSTTPASTCAALHSINGPIILLMGGRGKVKDYSEFSETLLPNKIKAIILFGEDRELLQSFIPDSIPTYLVPNLEKALVRVHSLAVTGDHVLLSPACTSWDQYSSYQERGEHFFRQNIISSLKSKG